MDGDEQPDARSGYEVVGRLVLPGLLRAKLRRLARARGLTPLRLATAVLSEWLVAEPEP